MIGAKIGILRGTTESASFTEILMILIMYSDIFTSIPYFNLENCGILVGINN